MSSRYGRPPRRDRPAGGPSVSGWDGGYFSEFVRQYSGKVVATRFGNKGHRMGCRFTLAQPQEDLVGGGVGECQSCPGGKLTARF